MSRRQDAISWAIIALTLVVVIVIGYIVIGPEMGSRTTIRLGDAVLTGKSIKTHSSGDIRLASDRQLSAGEADLVIFSSSDKWEIKPDNIKVSADIIWLDADKKVVYIVKNIEPENLKADNLRPNRDSRYILEVRSGTVDKKMIAVGTRAAFELGDQEGNI